MYIKQKHACQSMQSKSFSLRLDQSELHTLYLNLKKKILTWAEWNHSSRSDLKKGKGKVGIYTVHKVKSESFHSESQPPPPLILTAFLSLYKIYIDK